jgi:hypothetical protein
LIGRVEPFIEKLHEKTGVFRPTGIAQEFGGDMVIRGHPDLFQSENVEMLVNSSVFQGAQLLLRIGILTG